MAAAFALTYSVARRHAQADAFARACALAQNHYFEDGPRLSAWVERCFADAARWPSGRSPEEVVDALNDEMSALGVSHFAAFAPAADRALWTGRAVHTGLRSRYVDGHLMVYGLVADGAGARAGVRVGDEILNLPGVEEVSPAGATWRAGIYRLRRGTAEFGVRIEPGPITVEGAPEVRSLAGDVALLNVPTFRAQYFTAERVRAIARELAGKRGVIVDLRENSGGNLAAALRLLSIFLGAGRAVGTLSRSPRANDVAAVFPDDLDDELQIERLESAREIPLVTPAGYGAVPAPVIVLIASETASVSEIFASAMAARPATRVWGWPSAGDVLLAIWYDLPSLGPGFSVSIPRAAFTTLDDQRLEGRGVRPSRELFYDLEMSRQGVDGWINAAWAALR